MRSDFEIVDLPVRPMAVVRACVPVAELPSLFERAFHDVAAALSAQGIAIVGPPFGYYPTMPGETVDVEAAFPRRGPSRLRATSSPARCRAEASRARYTLARTRP